jgi:hypothetical protein
MYKFHGMEGVDFAKNKKTRDLQKKDTWRQACSIQYACPGQKSLFAELVLILRWKERRSNRWRLGRATCLPLPRPIAQAIIFSRLNLLATRFTSHDRRHFFMHKNILCSRDVFAYPSRCGDEIRQAGMWDTQPTWSNSDRIG